MKYLDVDNLSNLLVFDPHACAGVCFNFYIEKKLYE